MKTNMKVWAFGEKVVLRCLWYFSIVNCIIFVLSDTIYVTRNTVTAIRLKDLGIFSCLFFSFCLITSEIFHSCKFWPFSWGSETEVFPFLYRLREEEIPNRSTVLLPMSLAASAKIDSCYLPALIPGVQCYLSVGLVDVHLYNHFRCLGTGKTVLNHLLWIQWFNMFFVCRFSN